MPTADRRYFFGQLGPVPAITYIEFGSQYCPFAQRHPDPLVVTER